MPQQAQHGGAFLVGDTPNNPTKAEADVLRLLAEGIISTKRLAQYRKTKPRVIQKHLSHLRQKGWIDTENNILPNRGGTQPGVVGVGCSPYQRAHSPQFWIKILYSDERYLEKIGTVYWDDGNRICLWKDCVEIYANKGKSWDAPTVNEAVEASLDYFDIVIARIQNQNKIKLLKDRKQNIKLVKFHMGRSQDEIAKHVIASGEKFRIYAEDGKLRMIVDTSRGPEIETIGAGTAKPDMNHYERHVEDIINNNPPTHSEIQEEIKRQAQAIITQGQAILQIQEREISKHSGEKYESQTPNEKSKSEPIPGYA